MAYSVTALHDPENNIYFTLESDIPGLHVEAASLDEFAEIMMDLVPDLLPGEAVINVTLLVAGLSRVAVTA